MQLKTVEVDGTTYAEVQDGKPVFLDDGGKEVAFDAASAKATISRLSGETKSHREARQEAENALKAFEGIKDPAAALKALETVQNLDQKRLVDAGEVEAVKAAAVKAMQEKVDAANEAAKRASDALHREMIGGSFARSKYLADNILAPREMVEATFGKNFGIEDGKIVAKDAHGNQIYSTSRPGEPADFDEALEQIIGAWAYKDTILKGRGQSGTGATGGGGSGGSKTISRAEYDKLSPTEQRNTIAKGIKPID